MDEPRRQPPPYPPLALRERGNFISVRQQPDQDAGWGTLHRPKRFELPLMRSHSLFTRLGYEAEPSSEVWQFEAVAALTLQVNRISADRYANSVAVALLDQNNRRVAPLVESALGVGAPVRIEPGVYKVVAALGLSEQVKVELQFNALPARGLAGALPMQLNAGAALLQGGGSRTLKAAALLALRPHARLANDTTVLKATAPLALQAVAVMRAPQLVGRAGSRFGATAALHPSSISRLQGCAAVSATAAAVLPAVRWLDEPHVFWRGRVVAGVLELNRAYLADPRTAGGVLLLRQQLQDAGL